MRRKKHAIVTGNMPTATQDQIMYDDMSVKSTDHKVGFVKKIKWLPRFKWNLKLDLVEDRLEGEQL